ncbi:MAG: hypothetical protein IJB96_00445 [Lachnospira sp.]|nr:hypothetical protein [Lachnospira sp.]
MELKKSYKGFVLWMAGYVIAMFACAFLPVDSHLMSKIVINVCVAGIAVLALIIYKTEYIYWYNGVEYKDAVEAGSERRSVYALAHFKRFGLFAVLFLIYTVASYFFAFHIMVDVLIATIGLVSVAISTNWIEL